MMASPTSLVSYEAVVQLVRLDLCIGFGVKGLGLATVPLYVGSLETRTMKPPLSVVLSS